VERLYEAARARGRLRVPILMMPVGEHGSLTPPHDRIDGRPTGEGADTLRVGPMKLFLDGADKCAMCITPAQAVGSALRIGYDVVRARSLGPMRTVMRNRMRMGRDGKLRGGVRYYETDAPLVGLLDAATDAGFGIAIHAIGNDAVEQAVRVLGRVRLRHRDVPPPRIEHALLANAETLRRAADLGIQIVTQPPFIDLMAGGDIPRLRGLPFVGIRSMIDAGLHVAASSDAPVTSFEPLYGIRCAVERVTVAGTMVEPDEAVTFDDALAMYTREAARALGCLDVAGTIEVGKRADLVVLDGPHAAWPRVERTILGGETVYPRG
jgi:predicted amidohydrolase YtcJ